MQAKIKTGVGDDRSNFPDGSFHRRYILDLSPLVDIANGRNSSRM